MKLIARAVGAIWSISWLVILLAFVTAAPIVQLAVLGYLLLVTGRLANGSTIRQGVPGVRLAGRMGVVLTAIGLAALPTQLLTHWQSVAIIIDPETQSASLLSGGTVILSMILTVHLWWAWARGGRLRHYLWPQPIRFLKEAWRPKLWSDMSDQLWEFIVALRLPKLFWMGVRGAAGTLVWLIPGMLIMIVTREGKQAAAGLVGGLSFVVLGYVLMTLPFLQAHFAAEDRFKAIFDWRTVRRDLHFAPWSYAAALLIALVLMPIPLYLLKIEAIPEGVVWLPCLIFVAFMLPARIATGVCLRRARRLRAIGESQREGAFAPGFWVTGSRWFVRFFAAPIIVATYLLVLFGSQFTSWDGVDTWVRQHALLVPVPFIGI